MTGDGRRLCAHSVCAAATERRRSAPHRASMGTSDKTAHGYVCIPEGALTELRIEHLTSAIDMSVGLPQSVVDLAPNAISGYTEWVATWCGADVSLGWDWAYARGQILMLHPEEIR